MTNSDIRNSRIDALRCPTCGSRHTQTLEAAYSFSTRLFRDDHNRDAMADAMPPPRKRSEVVFPTIIATLAFALVHIASVVGAYELQIFDTPLQGAFDKRVIAPGAIVGVSAALVLIYRAATWNSNEYISQLKDWRSTAICRRCAAQFRPPALPASPEVE